MEKIIVKDNAIPRYAEIETWIQRFAEFESKIVNKKEYIVENLPLHFNIHIMNCIKSYLKKEVDPIYHYLRLSTKELDTDVRIHTDGTMNAQFAAVLHFSDSPMISPEKSFGTAFWSHLQYGDKVEGYVLEKEQDRILEEDASQINLFTMDGFVACKKNRLLIYPANYFHSRYPFVSWGKTKKDGRIVWVCFFKIIGENNENDRQGRQ
tara:strand:+ start:3176 stop:3799 length:624 start_codon:yes stop_codon:yes gene_type:complete